MRRAERYLAISSKKSFCAVEEKGKLRHKLIYIEAAAHSPFDVLHASRSGKRQFLNGGRAASRM